MTTQSSDRRDVHSTAPRAAEFFAGIGLVRSALEAANAQVVWANDIEPMKHAVYARNFDASDYVLGDVRDVRGDDMPDIEIATASFPCVDLSLAGNRAGLDGGESGMFWEFVRVLEEMESRLPEVLLLENVPSFGNSRQGADFRDALDALARLGYYCDVLLIDARRFTPQSRPRLFVIGALHPDDHGEEARDHPFRTPLTTRLRTLVSQPMVLTLPDHEDQAPRLSDVVERLGPTDPAWWPNERQGAFLDSLSEIQEARLETLKATGGVQWRTAYRRTREGVPRWEMRADEIAGCLRTARGGSSKQALVEVDGPEVRVRWLTARECARLQGVDPDFDLRSVTQNQALFGLGDAVCVPAVEWVARHCLVPLASRVPA